jgi:hypothetical protein
MNVFFFCCIFLAAVLSSALGGPLLFLHFSGKGQLLLEKIAPFTINFVVYFFSKIHSRAPHFYRKRLRRHQRQRFHRKWRGGHTIPFTFKGTHVKEQFLVFHASCLSTNPLAKTISKNSGFLY